MELKENEKKLLKSITENTITTGIILSGSIKNSDCFLEVKWNPEYKVYIPKGYIWDEIGEDYVEENSLNPSLNIKQINDLSKKIALSLKYEDNEEKIKNILKEWVYNDRIRRTEERDEESKRRHQETISSYTDT